MKYEALLVVDELGEGGGGPWAEFAEDMQWARDERRGFDRGEQGLRVVRYWKYVVNIRAS